jgi:hypothetical protein
MRDVLWQFGQNGGHVQGMAPAVDDLLSVPWGDTRLFYQRRNTIKLLLRLAAWSARVGWW